MYQPGEEAVPGYRLVRRLGSGNFGEVWQAAAPGGTQVALKFMSLDDKGLREFRSLKLVKRIRHPNLVPLMAYWVKDADGNILEDAETEEEVEQPPKVAETLVASAVRDMHRPRGSGPTELIVAMGLGDKSLYDRLAECQDKGHTCIPADELLTYMHQAASALDYLNHPVTDPRWSRAAIQHRDVKPQNILIVGGAAQVCDYGLARALDDTRNTCSLSPAYAAPESFEGKICSQTDQYSLAVSYIELRTGNLPFHDKSLMGILKAHRTGDLDLSELSPAEQAVIKRATSANPDERYPSCKAMVAALEEAITPQQKPPQRATWLWVSAGILLLVPVALFAIQRVISPAVNLPEGFVADTGAKKIAVGAEHFYDRIARVLPSGLRVPFVLIPEGHGGDLRSFYMMETKVWNGLVEEFAAANSSTMKDSQWRLGAMVNKDDLGVDNKQMPAFRMTAMEAHQLAEWLGGRLPSARQWDTAAGLFVEGAGNGPFAGSASGEPRVAVGRRDVGPMAVGEAADDVNHFGCRDMAGNGLEWTRTIDDNPSEALANREIPNLVEDDLIVLRGRSYASARPLLYEDLRSLSETQKHHEPSPEISFRVVVVPDP